MYSSILMLKHPPKFPLLEIFINPIPSQPVFSVTE
jgi:hypothetical protein